MTKKWTRTERAEASKKAKERWELKKRSATLTIPKGASQVIFETIGGGGGGSSGANKVQTPQDEAMRLAEMLGKERAYRTQLATHLVNIAADLLNGRM